MQVLDLALGVVWLVFWAYWFITAALTRSPFKRTQSCSRLLLFTIISVLALAILVEELPQGILVRDVLPGGAATMLVGLPITILGLGVAVWARVHLGRNWTSRPGIKVGHTLIRTGPYRFVRNPIYTGLLIGYTGTAIVIGTLWALFLILFVLGASLLKIREEERLLLEEFGEDYEQYRREVRALIPYIL
ncbi:MAG TPA: isoprenylcysteine carboxylmethyltransferase family protein [Methanomicrobiales archaeon]|nr:isoprenylcysteine carboxylmethyltransferase family protein [Methanomicrobiales archaeon]